MSKRPGEEQQVTDEPFRHDRFDSHLGGMLAVVACVALLLASAQETCCGSEPCERRASRGKSGKRIVGPKSVATTSKVVP
jgi:hypothetical protein